MVRTFRRTDTPVGLAVLVALLTWMGSQLYGEVREAIIASDGMFERFEGSNRFVVYHITNESLTKSIEPLKFALRCPESMPCFTKALDSPWGFVQAEHVAPWRLDVLPEADERQISVTVTELPPRGTAQIVASVPSPGVFPEFYFVADSAVPRILPPSNPLVFMARYYLELLLVALVAVTALAVWWMFSTES